MRNHENKAINLILEFSVGKVQKVIDEMINLHEPAILIVGTRGRSLGGFQGLLPGSVSKYCLQHSPVPVIVVRPTGKRAKTKRKRMQDPTRTGYRDLLDKSGSAGGHLLDTGHRHSVMIDELHAAATDEEAAAVAKAVGFNPSPLGQDGGQAPPQTPDSIGGGLMSGENSPDDTRDIGPVMKSPELQNLDTPAVSSDEDSSDDEGGVQMFSPNPRSSESQESPGISPGTNPADQSKTLTMQETDSRQDVSPGTTTPAVENPGKTTPAVEDPGAATPTIEELTVASERKASESSSEISKEKS
ncbi:UspA [Macrophomina phaseolina MS6]|uniref:UspA n=1 Tax=Macrophomina phaseolina (strain MS6) TaxID=1126212 RepID=K2SU03_MACPH|nr:UspA [Macrophomina phaseolina MS6]